MFKNYLFTILSGLLLAFSWPTYGFTFLVFIGLVPLLLAERNIRNQSKKHNNFHTFFASYIGFVVWNVITTWWIWNSTAVGGVFAILVNSLLMSTVFQLYHIIAKRKPLRFSLIFLVTIWISFEKFHLNWDFSWPWLNLGNAFSEQHQWIQWYEFTGVFGGSLWIWLVNISFFNAVLFYKNNVGKSPDNKLLIYTTKRIFLGVGLIVIGIFTSLLMYYNYKEKGEAFTSIVLQPNTDPYTEKYYQSSEKIAKDLLDLAKKQMDDNVSFVLGPETVFSKKTSFEDFQKTKAFDSIKKFIEINPNVSILTGIDLYKLLYGKTAPTPTSNKINRKKDTWYESYNAAIYINNEDDTKVYNKSKLVVGVEHFPFRSILQPLLGDVMIDLGGTISTLTPQKEVSVFHHSNKKLIAAPVICYESIYGEFVGRYVKKNANFLAIITNDSWWGETQGHKQLLSYAKLRAIEHRRAIARSANSGISSFINQRGDILKRLEYNTKGVLKETLFANNEKTFYSIYGDFIARISSLIAFLFFMVGVFVKKR